MHMPELLNRADSIAAAKTSTISTPITMTVPAPGRAEQFGTRLEYNGQWMKQFLHSDRHPPQRPRLVTGK
jgi:hypothetical protein